MKNKEFFERRFLMLVGILMFVLHSWTWVWNIIGLILIGVAILMEKQKGEIKMISKYSKRNVLKGGNK